MSPWSFKRLRLCLAALASALLLLLVGRSLLLAQTAALAQVEIERAASLKASSNSPTVLGMPTVFTATVEDSQSLTLTWAFGDGSQSVGAVVSHTYPAPGRYVAVVTATGEITQSLVASTTVQVDKPVDGLSMTYTGTLRAGSPITFTAAVSQGSRVSYEWDFNDGSLFTGNLISHTFLTGGWYTVVVTAANRVSWMTETAQVTITHISYLPLAISYWPPVPRSPQLLPVKNEDGDFVYSLEWTYPKSPPVITFTLQEAREPTFSLGVRTVCETRQTSCEARVTWGGVYYYRVRGQNSWGVGGWSPVQAVNLHSERFPNDPSYASQWGLQRINAPGAWGMSSGAGVVIAVIDSGVDLQHPDLAGKLWNNSDEAGGNGRDDDGNGYIDDVLGWDFISKDSQPQDENGHGTHVSGIAAAATDNGTGVSGLGWDARLMPLKVLDAQGMGYLTDVVAAVYYAVQNGAQVINMSLAAEQYMFSLQQATDYASSRGSLVLAAAGNCGDDSWSWNGCSTLNPVIFPAANPNVLGVAATGGSDAGSHFSERGYFVDIAAPGENILSTFPGGSYRAASGTSMASPFAAGLAALVWGRNPLLTNQQVAQVIMLTASDLGSPGRDDVYGYGRLDARAAVAGATNPVVYELDGEIAEVMSEAVQAYDSGDQLGVRPDLALEQETAFRPGVLILQLKPGSLESGRASFLSGSGLRLVREFAGTGLVEVRVPVGEELRKAEELSADPAVVFAEPDYVLQMVR